MFGINEVSAKYQEVRQPGDADLVQEIRQILVESGLGLLAQANYDTHRFIQEASVKRPEIQRFLINKFWHLQLPSVDANSIEERFHLIDNGEDRDWLNMFRIKVVPFLVTHQLPRAI